MMSKKQLACMLTLHLIYLLLGASIFYHIEGPKEMNERAEKKLERLEIQNMLYDNYIPGDPEKQDAILTKLSDYCGKTLFNYTSGDEEGPIKWNFYHSFFFSYTVVSTIGYGNVAPTTHAGRILMIPYALFGMPINAILLANMGEYFGLKLIKIYRKYKRRSERRADVLDYFFQHLGMLGQIFLYLIPGFLFFIFLPACLFMVFEGWDYVGSIYYAFVTLTTIGFGDIVAGTVNNGFADGYFVAYEIFLIAWITFGLGYVVMLLGFITSGLRSEGVHRLEQKLANQFKSTQNRILQGFTRDVAVIRKIINEANLIKLKPIYVEEAPRLCQSASCPELTFYAEPRDPVYKRKRANSENIHLSRDMLRIQSDTDLLGIDKEKTFTASAVVKPAEFLARVVNVLGNYEDQQQREREEQGVHMFDDRDILASEKPPLWSIGNDSILSNSPYSMRNRALSVAVPNYRKESIPKINNDHTWTNGVRPDFESINKRSKLSLPTSGLPMYPVRDDNQPRGLLSRLFRKSSSTENPLPPSPDSPIEKPRNRTRRGSFFPTIDTSQEKNDADKYKEKTKRGRHSIFPTFDFNETDEDSIAKSYKEKTKRGRHSVFPTFDFNIDEDEDENMAKAYKEKTKRGRTSIFPSFDFNEHDEDDMARAYKEKTKKGRHSIFPTFDFNIDDDEEEDRAKAYREKTKRGRHSIFPTFNFNEDDDEMANKYKESTKKGRRSIFPTFNFGDDKKDDDSIDEDEVKNYQNRTKKGRGSLFPTFGKSKKNDNDDDTIPEDSEEVRRYQNKTKRGRTSLFPTFGKDRKPSNTDDDPSSLAASIKKYQNMTKHGRSSLFSDDNDDSELERYRNRTRRGRPSLFDPDVDITELPQAEQVEALEQTSVADLLRVLAVLDTVSPSTSGQQGIDTTPLADIISGAVNATNPGNRRRGSIRPDFALPAIPARGETEETGPRRRRVSARAVAPQFTPTLQTVVAGSELQTTALSSRENRMSMLSSPPPPYSESEAEPEQEDSSQTKTRRFSPVSGGPGSKTGPVPRLFSRIRRESATSIEEEDSRRGSLTDVVVDNNKNDNKDET